MQATLPVPVRHRPEALGREVAVYVWQYPLRLVHWGIVISIVALSFTGYYIHDPFIVGQVNRPFLMGWFRFVHEAFAMVFIALFLVRIYLFFGGNRWVNWRQYVPTARKQFGEMVHMAKFYLFMAPRPVSKIGHNPLAAVSYLGVYALMLIEILTGLTMYQWLRHSPILSFFVGWIPRVIAMPNIRLIHFVVMFLFFCFVVIHIHISMLVSRFEKKGLMDSIFMGYKVIPEREVEQEMDDGA
jgi:Ni/Fe-hydrogenase 1 B-type cytochrome subunit